MPRTALTADALHALDADQLETIVRIARESTESPDDDLALAAHRLAGDAARELARRGEEHRVRWALDRNAPPR